MDTVVQPELIDAWQHTGHVHPMRIFRDHGLDTLPAPAAAYLRHAIASETLLPKRVRLTMHGHLKAGAWLPFTAEQVIDCEHGSWWTARIASGLLHARDSFDHGQGRTRVRAAGIPVVSADGPDVTRSALGRFLAEQAAWMPGNLLPDAGTHWHAPDTAHAVAIVPAGRTYTRLGLGIEPDGALRDLTMSRWGRIGKGYGEVPFGMRADAEATFGGFTVVSKGRVGWGYGTDAWPAGEFFRFTIDDLCPF
jgi:hypothetical protein